MRKATEDDAVHHFGGKVYAKQYTLAAGASIVQHRHSFDHLSILASGKVMIHVDGETTELEGPACITIQAQKHHAIKALTDTVWFCVHAFDDHDLTIEEDRQEAQDAADALGLGALA